MRTSDGSNSTLGGRRLRKPLTPLAGASVVALALLSTTPACDPTLSAGAVYDEATGVPMLDGGAGGPVTITIGLAQGTIGFGGSGAMGGASAVGGVGTGGTTSAATGTGGSTAGPIMEAPLTSAFCGDGVRDTVKEECDDGPALQINGASDIGDFCSEYCQVTDARVVVDNVADTPKATIARRLGAGRHPTAASANGFAVALVQQGPVKDTPSVRVARFDALGHRTGLVEASTGMWVQAADADPVVAMTPSDDVIVAFTDFGGDGDGKGIAARVIRAGKTSPEKAVYVAQQRFGAQYAPDILVLSDRVIIAWTDESEAQSAPDIRYREFSFDLAPLGDEKTLVAAANVQGRVALAALGTSWGATWRSSNGEGLETTEVYDANTGARFSVPAHLPAHAEEIPALLPLDDTHRVLVFTAGVNMDEAGDAGVGDVYTDELFVAALDVQSPGAVTVTPLAVTPAYQSYVSLSRRRPAIVRTQTEAYLAWWSGAPLANTQGEDVWLERLTASITNGTLNLTLGSELRLPRWPSELTADQRFPALVVSSPIPANAGGSLFAAWEDYSGTMAGASHPEVVAQLAPLQIVRSESLVTSCGTTSTTKCSAGRGPCNTQLNNQDCQSPLVCKTGRGPQFDYGINVAVCIAAHCANNTKDQDESGVDCGGVDCGTCTCGDGVYSPMLGETCDDGHETAACEANCQLAICGDKIVNTQRGEQCDNGPQNADNQCGGCNTSCQLNPYCGNGVIDSICGEQCDDGAANNGTVNSHCTQLCQTNTCGDGVQGLGEQCDHGAQNANNQCGGCNTSCQLNPYCGNGVTDSICAEQCDDGNTNQTDACAACGNARCGDGYIWRMHEQCELNETGCNSSCRWPSCGNGIVNTGEPCDDGNTSNTDGCVFGCRHASCGDGYIQAGFETCDHLYDPNCSTTCTASVGCTDSGSCLAAWSRIQTSVSDTPTDAQVAQVFRIRNMGLTEVSLDRVKLRYWFSKDSNQGLTNVSCAATTLSCDNIHRTITSTQPSYRGADTMLELTFTGGTMLQNATGTNDIRMNFAKVDGSNFTETNDFSYINTTTITPNPNMALYLDGQLVWGSEPHSVPFCGDQIVDSNEQCDPGIETAGCTANCTTSTCGDGIVNKTALEDCESNRVNTATCDSDCTTPRCGDGILNTAAGEVCDPGVSSNCKSDCSGLLPTQGCTPAGSCLHVDQKVEDNPTNDDKVAPVLRLVNSGTTADVNLNNISVRYWFTGDDSAATFTPHCDYAGLNNYSNQCGNVNQTITTIATVAQADHYLRVSFSGGIVLAKNGGSTNDIKLRISRSTSGNFNENNDWSYINSTGYVTSPHITIYNSTGELIWGQEP